MKKFDFFFEKHRVSTTRTYTHFVSYTHENENDDYPVCVCYQQKNTLPGTKKTNLMMMGFYCFTKMILSAIFFSKKISVCFVKLENRLSIEETGNKLIPKKNNYFDTL